jgi:long-subunit fatty acid transport protein
MRISDRILLVALLAVMSLTAAAQSEGGLIAGAEVEKKVSKQLTVGVEADLRTRNNFKTMDRWSVGLGASYKFNKWLKADAGYVLLNTNFREDIDYKSSGAYNHWRPSYWGFKHRVYASLSGSYKFQNNIRLSLRERWQYTYRPEKTLARWDFDDECWEDKARSGKGKNQLRSRLQVEYDKKKALFTPFASVEFYNAWSVEKIRYNVGTDIRLDKQHSLSVFYRFQQMKNVDADDYDPDMHYLGVGYKLKF